MEFREEYVNLGLINFSDTRYRISTEKNIDTLAESINTVGLIHPPVLKERGSEFLTICGFRRIEAYRFLEQTFIRARIIENSESELDCVKLAIADNSLQRSLNLIEESRCLRLLSGLLNEKVRLTSTAAALNLAKTASGIDKLIKIASLPEHIQDCILKNNISPATALEIGGFENTISITFTNLFDILKPSLNKQREIITLSREISLRDGVPINTLLNTEKLTCIINDEKLDRNQKTVKLRRYLKVLRFPNISESEEEFKRNVDQLNLGKNIKLVPPPNFEDNTYTLVINFRSVKELEKHRLSLGAILQHQALRKIVDN